MTRALFLFNSLLFSSFPFGGRLGWGYIKRTESKGKGREGLEIKRRKTGKAGVGLRKFFKGMGR